MPPLCTFELVNFIAKAAARVPPQFIYIIYIDVMELLAIHTRSVRFFSLGFFYIICPSRVTLTTWLFKCLLLFYLVSLVLFYH